MFYIHLIHSCIINHIPAFVIILILHHRVPNGAANYRRTGHVTCLCARDARVGDRAKRGVTVHFDIVVVGGKLKRVEHEACLVRSLGDDPGGAIRHTSRETDKVILTPL